MVTIDDQYEVSKQILPLYDYMNRRLIEANTKNDTGVLDEVQGMVEEFRDTWKQVLLADRKLQHGSGGNA